jgi:hypothetical protein
MYIACICLLTLDFTTKMLCVFLVSVTFTYQNKVIVRGSLYPTLCTKKFLHIFVFHRVSFLYSLTYADHTIILIYHIFQ